MQLTVGAGHRPGYLLSGWGGLPGWQPLVLLAPLRAPRQPRAPSVRTCALGRGRSHISLCSEQRTGLHGFQRGTPPLKLQGVLSDPTRGEGPKDHPPPPTSFLWLGLKTYRPPEDAAKGRAHSM